MLIFHLQPPSPQSPCHTLPLCQNGSPLHPPKSKKQNSEQKNIHSIFYYSKNYYLCSMNNPLSQFGNIPVTVSALESLYPQLKGKHQKIRWLERNGQIIRLKRGLYVCSPGMTGTPLSTALIANHLYSPSYVSMSSALRYYGLIPEAVYVTQSMTLKHSRSFNTSIGRFEYTAIARAAFPVGLTNISRERYAFVIASPEKALCDLIAHSPQVNLRYLKDAEIYLEEDIRMELEDFKQMNPKIFESYIPVGKKPESIKTLLKLLKK